MRTNTILGLPSVTLNLLAGGVSISLILIGVKALRSPDLALEVANTKLVTSSSATRLEELADKLEKQAQVIKQKDEAYAHLESIYEQSLKGKQGYGRLQRAIEDIDQLPKADDIDEIKTKISETERTLSEVISE